MKICILTYQTRSQALHVIDIDLVVAYQQLFRGLGLRSILIDYQPKYRLQTPFIAPPLVETPGSLIYFQPDAMVVGQNPQATIFNLGSQISRFPNQSTSKSDYILRAQRLGPSETRD